jgi:hypothetical protein
MLYRVYVHGADRSHVAAEMRALRGGSPAYANVPPFPGARTVPPAFATTIAALGAFDASAYPALLDAWCRATLIAYGA